MCWLCYSVPGEEEEPNKPVADESIVSQLVSMGFSHLHCQKAAINTSNTGVEEAMNWLLSHMDDPGNSRSVIFPTTSSESILLGVSFWAVTWTCYIFRALNNIGALFLFQISMLLFLKGDKVLLTNQKLICWFPLVFKKTLLGQHWKHR